jgi:hypothetical protein
MMKIFLFKLLDVKSDTGSPVFLLNNGSSTNHILSYYYVALNIFIYIFRLREQNE